MARTNKHLLRLQKHTDSVVKKLTEIGFDLNGLAPAAVLAKDAMPAYKVVELRDQALYFNHFRLVEVPKMHERANRTVYLYYCDPKDLGKKAYGFKVPFARLEQLFSDTPIHPFEKVIGQLKGPKYMPIPDNELQSQIAEVLAKQLLSTAMNDGSWIESDTRCAQAISNGITQYFYYLFAEKPPPCSEDVWHNYANDPEAVDWLINTASYHLVKYLLDNFRQASIEWLTQHPPHSDEDDLSALPAFISYASEAIDMEVLLQ